MLQQLPLTFSSNGGIGGARNRCLRLPSLSSVFCRRQRVTTYVLCIILFLVLLASFKRVRDTLCRDARGSTSCFLESAPGAIPSLDALTHLVLVAGNAVFTGTKFELAEEDGQWSLEDYQLGQGRVFLEHIKKAVEIVDADPDALLIFSGGKTRSQAGPLSESESYWRLASAKAWFGFTNSVSWRALTEDHARDSFENLLFSICRFRQVTGRYPSDITMISLELKRDRIETQHRVAIRYPLSRFHYIGIDPAFENPREHGTSEGLDRAAEAFAADPYGCFHETLLQKRKSRNPFKETIPYPAGCPEIARLVRYCGRDIYKGPLPWDSQISRRSP
ncbi:hypothetical protein CCYA_CCYA10G2815 [Cyanidiococcus yangmingshanensis]|nr:hypothetical protein CCYA_CCYA10G2815 [Cyanidiococcus yangmingshanensis]